MRIFQVMVAGMTGCVLAVTSLAESRTVLRSAVLRSGPGAYYEALVEVPAGTPVDAQPPKHPVWVEVQALQRQGWLPEKAFEPAGKGVEFAALLKGGAGMAVSAADMAAATKGMVGTTYRDRPTVQVAVAEQLASLRIDAPMVQTIEGSLSGGATGVRMRVPAVPEAGLVMLRPDAELELGQALAVRVAEQGLVADEKAVRYVNAVAAVVGARTERYDLPYRVGILKASGVNGFGLPGGYVLISEQLLALAQDEAELACLIGHEMAHISRFHGMREFNKRSTHRQSDSVFDELDATDDTPASDHEADLNRLADTAYLTIIGKRARVDEIEADLYGVRYAAAAGYDPGAMVRVLRRIADAQQGESDDAFRHHPSLDERMAAIEQFVRQSGTEAGGQTFAGRFREQLADRAR
ncbi:MAG: hypothetical protein A2340_11375 [Lentisphaerae bacterium RIFOXYB12_FULL_60_10]|nr:MAG: hypothetical protein A2340_11375 [Lentisphaerae bacterium RIFOXYB12_FULL_60_10]